MSRTWSEDAARYLESTNSCPRCDMAMNGIGRCTSCGAELDTPEAVELLKISLAAATLLHRRQELVDTLPTTDAAPVHVPVTAPVAVAAAASPLVAAGSGSTLSVQSVLAVAGAGLVAVAAFVFTFLNPDLTDFATRTLIVACITVVFLGGAWLLARAGLQFSAEAVGALGTVFAALDIWALSTRAPDGLSPWAFAAVGTLVVSGGLVALSTLARIRSWLWIGLIGVTLAPAMVGYAAPGTWGPIFGHIGVIAVAWALGALLPRLEPRFTSGLRADRGTLVAVQGLASAVVSAQLVVIFEPEATTRVLLSALALALLGVLARITARRSGSAVWSYFAGAFLAFGVAILPLAATLELFWFAALVPCAAAVAMLGVAALLRTPGVSIGAWTIVLLAGIPAAAIVLYGAVSLGSATLASFASREYGLAAIAGLAAVSAGSWGLSLLARRGLASDNRLSQGARTTAAWLGAFTLVGVVVWSGFLPVTQVVLGLVLVAALAISVHRVTDDAVKPAMISAAHVLLLLSAAISWSEPILRLVAGAVIVLLVLLVGRTLARAVRPLYVALAYAYALVLVANALEFAGLEVIAVLCLTTSVGSLFAIAITLAQRVPARHWYAIIGVTAVPFLVGVGSVIAVRSGWTGLSTGVTFALALTLVVSRRPGLTRAVRAGAAALLVPSLAVVVICLGAQFILVSASPITLPIIAGIVAVALPLTGVVGSALERHGLSTADARAVRLWIEISSLVTGAIAVLLALVRVAAGLDTTLLVLLIIGVGGAATAVFMRRRYGWVVAAASWTGALWCFWALNGIDFLEPYTLPPALGAVIVGAVGVALGKPARWLFTAGLTGAVIPTLGILAVSGGTGAPVRAIVLLVASIVLLVAALTVGRWERVRALVTPTLVLSVVAASAGVVQAIRYGRELDPVSLANPDYVILPVLAFTVPATLLAIAAGRAAQARGAVSRWLYAPALAFLVLGPMTAIRRDWLPVWILWGLMALVLVIMLVTVARDRSRRTTLPPVAFTYAVAWCTGVVGWTMRDLRVEVFSLPLGLALLAAGIIAMRRSRPVSASLGSWPHGFAGSWYLLTPGILATLLPSMLATGTDPQTARAILVIGLALVAILIGSLRKLAAPFILGIIVLPIENVIVFAVQVGQSIGAAPWWITLATAGAVLLVIAVTYERRGKTVGGFSARLRDLT